MKEKCPLCPKNYQSEKDLDAHLKKIHNTSLKSVKAIQKLCEKEFIDAVKQSKKPISLEKYLNQNLVEK